MLKWEELQWGVIAQWFTIIGGIIAAFYARGKGVGRLEQRLQVVEAKCRDNDKLVTRDEYTEILSRLNRMDEKREAARGDRDVQFNNVQNDLARANTNIAALDASLEGIDKNVTLIMNKILDT